MVARKRPPGKRRGWLTVGAPFAGALASAPGRAGVAVGLVAAPLATAALRGMLFEVSPRDLAVLASVAAALVAIGGAASLVPALRAARLDPMAALREE